MLTSLHKQYQIVKLSPPLAGVLNNLRITSDNYCYTNYIVFEQKVTETPSYCYYVIL
jgi:hypothetical protein